MSKDNKGRKLNGAKLSMSIVPLSTKHGYRASFEFTPEGEKEPLVGTVVALSRSAVIEKAFDILSDWEHHV